MLPFKNGRVWHQLWWHKALVRLVWYGWIKAIVTVEQSNKLNAIICCVSCKTCIRSFRSLCLSLSIRKAYGILIHYEFQLAGAETHFKSIFFPFPFPTINSYRFSYTVSLSFVLFFHAMFAIWFYVYLRVYVVFILISIQFRYLNSQGVERKHFYIILFVAVRCSSIVFRFLVSPLVFVLHVLCAIPFYYQCNIEQRFLQIKFLFVGLMFCMYVRILDIQSALFLYTFWKWTKKGWSRLCSFWWYEKLNYWPNFLRHKICV